MQTTVQNAVTAQVQLAVDDVMVTTITPLLDRLAAHMSRIEAPGAPATGAGEPPAAPAHMPASGPAAPANETPASGPLPAVPPVIDRSAHRPAPMLPVDFGDGVQFQRTVTAPFPHDLLREEAATTADLLRAETATSSRLRAELARLDQLAPIGHAAAPDSDAESEDETPASRLPSVVAAKHKFEKRQRELNDTYFAHHLVKVKAQDALTSRAEIARSRAVRKAELRATETVAAAMEPGQALQTLRSVIASMAAEIKFLGGQMLVLENMGSACHLADETPEPAEFFNALSRRWGLEGRSPAKLNACIKGLQDSPLYANWLKPPAAVAAPAGAAATPKAALPVSRGIPSSTASVTAAAFGKRKTAAPVQRSKKKAGRGAKGAASSDDE